jgi:hypothetical protein
MASTNTVATLDGLYKSVYGEKGPINLLPDCAILQELVPFESAERTGKSFNVPVVVSAEQGFSFGLADETITLNTEVAATLKNLEVKGAQIVGQASINYDAASRSMGSKQAFMSGAGLVVQNLYESHSQKLEASLLYGTSSIGTVSSLSSQDIILTAASFADGLWMGKEGAVIDVYNGSSVRRAALVVSAVHPSTYTITVTGTATGIVANDKVYLKGAYGKECYGLDSIITNSGSMFGIDAAAYSLWAGNSYSASSAPLTMAKVLSAASMGVSKGGLNGDAVCLVHPSSWNNLNSNESALRSYQNSESKASNGFDAIEYRYAGGKIKIISHPMVKRGEAFIFSPKNLKRVGSTDISSQTPGKDNNEIFLHSSTVSAYLLRTYSNQAIISTKPAAMVKITAIVPN